MKAYTFTQTVFGEERQMVSIQMPLEDARMILFMARQHVLRDQEQGPWLKVNGDYGTVSNETIGGSTVIDFDTALSDALNNPEQQFRPIKIKEF